MFINPSYDWQALSIWNENQYHCTSLNPSITITTVKPGNLSLSQPNITLYYKRHGFVPDLNHFSVIYPRGTWCYTLLINVTQSWCTGMQSPNSQCMFQNLTCLVIFTQGINIPATKSTSRSKCFRSSLSLVRVKILFFSIFATALASSSIINPDFACKWKWLWK